MLSVRNSGLKQLPTLFSGHLNQSIGSARSLEGADFTPYVESDSHATEALAPGNGKLQMLPTSSTYSEAFYSSRIDNKNTLDNQKQVQTKYEDKQPLFEIDVERVLEEQDTHDLYCPNCNSCITKRVILRKRKRTVRDVRLDAKRERIQPIQTDIIATPGITETTDGNRDQEPDVFRCLSCFSFFIPTDRGFRLFQLFGKKEESEGLQTTQPGPANDSNWIFSCFEFIGGKKETGSAISEPKDDNLLTIAKDSKEFSEGGSSIGYKDGRTLEDQEYRPAQGKNEDFLSPGPGPVLIQDTTVGRKGNQEPVRKDKQAASEPKDAKLVTIGKDFKQNSEGGSIMMDNKDGKSPEDQEYRPEQGKNEDFLSSEPGSVLIQGTAAGRKGKQEPVGKDKQAISEPKDAKVVTIFKDSNEKSDGESYGVNNKDEQALEDQEYRSSLGNNEDCSLIESSSELIHDTPVARKGKPEFLGNDKQGIRQSEENSSSHMLIPEAARYLPNLDFQMGIEEAEGFKTQPLENSENMTSQDVGKPHMSLDSDMLRQNSNEVVSSDILTALNQDSFLPDEVGADLKGDGFVSSLVDVNKPSQVPKDPLSEQPIPVTRPPLHSLRDDTRLVIEEGIPTESREGREWDVLKAIVYGGLIEAITSLGVISSASGGDAGTLNIVALGLANLVGGLFLIVHNLFDLRNELNEVVDGTEEQTGRYWNLLGRRGHFKLHMAAALISFVIVGILPPAIYGFAFRKTDNKEYKLIAVAAASLTCIALLSIAKAHVQRSPKPYVKNLFYYVGLGLAASGLSYVAGVFIHRLLEQLGLFDNSSSTVPTPPVQELDLTTVSSPWTSQY